MIFGYSVAMATGAGGGGLTTGAVVIEPQTWQIIATPQRFGYWDAITHTMVDDDNVEAKFMNTIIEQVNDLYGEGLITQANALIGDELAFRNYLAPDLPNGWPGTSVNSRDNFPLVWADDNGIYEIVGYFVYSAHDQPIELTYLENR